MNPGCNICGRLDCRSCPNCADCPTKCQCNASTAAATRSQPAEDPSLLSVDVPSHVGAFNVSSEVESNDPRGRRSDLSEVALIRVASPRAMYRRYLVAVTDVLPGITSEAQKLFAAALVYCAFYWNELSHRRSLQNLTRRLSDGLRPGDVRKMRDDPDIRRQVVSLLTRVQGHAALKALRQLTELTPGHGGQLLIDVIADKLLPELSTPTAAFKDTARRMREGLLKVAEQWFSPTCIVEIPGAGRFQATAKLSPQGNEGEQFLACACINLARYALGKDTSPLGEVATVLEEAFGQDFVLVSLGRLRTAYDRGNEEMPSFETQRPLWASIVRAFETVNT